MPKTKQKQARQHEWNYELGNESCTQCGIIKAYADGEPCEEEDLTMWCNPGELVLEMLDRQAEKD